MFTSKMSIGQYISSGIFNSQNTNSPAEICLKNPVSVNLSTKALRVQNDSIAIITVTNYTKKPPFVL